MRPRDGVAAARRLAKILGQARRKGGCSLGRRAAAVKDIAERARALHSDLCLGAALGLDPAVDAAAIRAVVDPADDIVVRAVAGAPVATLLVFHDGMVDLGEVASLAENLAEDSAPPRGDVTETPTVRSAIDQILAGGVIVLRRGLPAWAITLPASLDPPAPQEERVVRGPQVALTPDLEVNLALIRNFVQRRDLRVEFRRVSEYSTSRLAIVYLAGKADPAVGEILRRRLDNVNHDTIYEVTMLKPTLADDPFSPFVNVQLTERVDLCALGLLGGRHVLLANGSADALVLPCTWPELMSSPEDRYLPRFIADSNRVLRHLGAFLALTLESAFIAVTTVNQELLPTPLAYAIARSRVGVPLPPVAEVLLMALVVEILREATVRLPSVLSQTIAIVGALVLGQAVVQANLISAPVIVLVALVALASFVVPQYEGAVIVRVLRFPAMLCAAVLGLYGLTLFFVAVLLHMSGLRSFGVPYLAPVAPHRGAPPWNVIRAPPWLRRRMA